MYEIDSVLRVDSLCSFTPSGARIRQSTWSLHVCAWFVCSVMEQQGCSPAICFVLYPRIDRCCAQHIHAFVGTPVPADQVPTACCCVALIVFRVGVSSALLSATALA